MALDLSATSGNCPVIDSDEESRAGAKRKQKHLRCDFVSSVCTRCQKNGDRCIRTASRIKFRHGSSAKYDITGFSTSQTWLKPSKSYVDLKYIDETVELAAIYDQEDGAPTRHNEPKLDQEQEQQQQQQQPQQQQADQPPAPDADADHASAHGGEDPLADFPRHAPTSFSTPNTHVLQGDSLDNLSQLGDVLWHSPIEQQRTASYSTRARAISNSQKSLAVTSPNRSHNLEVPSPQGSFLGTLVKSPASTTAQTNSELEVILIRYFIDVLARWYDICDPEKHFELIVPHRARHCPTLKKAIIAASARHLTRVCNPDSRPDFVYSYEGQVLRELNEETALQYHSECIKDLLSSSVDPEQTQDASLLAAAIILRFYEEIDAPLREDKNDHEIFLRVMNVFIDAQIPSVPLVPHSSPVINGPRVAPPEPCGPVVFSPQTMHSPTVSSEPSGLNDGTASSWGSDGLCQASFWVALRQEIHSAFLKQRPFNLALARCEAFRSFYPAEDAVWADRLIIFCADVLEFCYGNTKTNQPRHDPSTTPKDRWLTLKQYEKMWDAVLPASFEPIYFRDPDRSKGEVFPKICYLADCHITGIQHAELARILLAVYDPTRPKLGPGYMSSMRALSTYLKAAVLRLCGVATSNPKCPPAMITAYLGIAMCGDHFEDPLEQEGILGILDCLETRLGWPPSDTKRMLKEAWGQTAE